MSVSSKQATMADVAELAGVSRASVSRVFLGQKKVSEATRKKVFAAAEKLGYVPNVMASGLASKENHTIGLLLRDASNPAYGLLFTELQRAAQDLELNLVSMTISIDRKNEKQIASLHHLLGMRVAGLIVATGGVPSEQLLPFHERVPIIRAGRPEPTGLIHAVSYDEDDAGRQLANFVADCGHREIAVIRTAAEASFPEWIRASTMLSTLQERGLRPAIVDVNDNSGIDELLPLIQSGTVTAVMCPSDKRQLDVIRACHAAGLRVPEDVSITGCDGILPGVDLLGLSTYRIPVEDVALAAVSRITELISNPTNAIINDRYQGVLIPGATVARLS